jgi:putative transposase
MKCKRFSIEQTVAELEQTEADMPVTTLIPHVVTWGRTFDRSKKVYAGLRSDQERQLKQLPDESAKWQTAVAHLTPGRTMLTDLLKATPKRIVVDYLNAERRARPLVKSSQSVHQHRSRRDTQTVDSVDIGYLRASISFIRGSRTP